MIPLLSLPALVPVVRVVRLLPLVPVLQVAATAQPSAPATAPASATIPAPPSQAPSGRVVRLDEAVQTALRSQPTVHEARAQTEAASGQADQARAPMLPQLNAQATYQRQHGGASAFSPSISPSFGTTIGPTGLPVSSSPADHDLFSFGAAASMLVYDFNQSPDKLRAANRSVDSLRASEHTAELGVLLNVRRAFFAARAYKALVGVAQETLQNEDRHMTQIRGYVAAGTHPEIDLVQERTTLANDKVALINAQNNYEIGKAQLNQAMGVVGDTNYDVAEEGLPVVAGEEGPDEQLVDTALKARPEIVALQKQREADQLTVRALKGGYGPSLTAGAAGGT
ncbi:MAG TPA: TolC family protein, partial [Polyangiaceae bacterium]